MREHCVQCVTEIQANGRQTPAGETLCAPCYSALWGPATTDEFRGQVALHMGHQIPGRLASQPAS